MSLQGTVIIVIILSTLTIDFIMNITAERLNLANIKTTLPDEFKGYYDQSKYVKSQDYLKVSTKFGFVTAGTDLLLFLIFWFCHGFSTLDIWVRSWEMGSVPTGLAYMGILILLKGIVSLPFSIYSTFVIEERFGFNKTTPMVFMKDLVKTLVISTLLGSILMGAILAFLEYSGEWAWLICWGVSTLFILAVQYIVPTWIMPPFQ